MNTPEPYTIDELCRRLAGTMRIGEDHFIGIAKSAKYIFPLPATRQSLELVLRLLPDNVLSHLTIHGSAQHVDGFEDGSIKIVDFGISRDKHNLQLTGNLFRYS
jgi:hypothetical protein